MSRGATPIFLFTGLACAVIAGCVLGLMAAIAGRVFQWLT
jgi:hypothetical protein